MSHSVIYQLTVAVCLWQVAAAYSTPFSNIVGTKGLPGGILDGIIQTALKQAEAVVDRLENQILAAVQNAQSNIQSGHVEFSNRSASAVTEAEKQVNSSVKKINATLSRWQALAQAQQLDVGECLQQEQGLAELPEQLQRCVTASGDAVEQVAASLNSSVQAAGGWQQLQQSQLQGCLDAPLTAVACLASSAVQAAAEGQRVVTALLQQAQVFQQSICSAITSTQTCVSSEAQSALASFQQAVNAVQQCIAGKLTPVSTSAP